MFNWRKKLASALLGMVLALPLPAYASVQKDGVHITVLHTNDMHARVQSSDDEGKTIGMDWLAGAIWNQKGADADTLVLDAGDTFHGVTLINLSRGSNMAMLMNLSGYDAMTPGNHDFNFGSQRLVELASMLNFPVLSANLMDKEQKQYVFRPYKSYEFNGVKVAVVGLTTPETAYKTNPFNVKDVAFADPIAVAKELVPKLRATHDVVIGLMHMGVDKSSAITSERIAKEVPGFDVIIDGHSHTTLPQGLKVGKTLVQPSRNDALGYVKQTIPDKDMGARELTIQKDTDGIMWGAVYAQYFEDMDKVEADGKNLTIQKELLKDGQVVNETTPLQVGDKLTVRLKVQSDRDIDFVQIKDERAACMEPIDVLSGYRWKGGLGMYQSTKDASTLFFVDVFRKGEYVIEYQVYINRKGVYGAGAATIQSAYAPEFSGRSGGQVITVL